MATTTAFLFIVLILINLEVLRKIMATKTDLDNAIASVSTKVDVKSAEVLAAINALAQVQDLADSVAAVEAVGAKVDAIPTVPTI